MGRPRQFHESSVLDAALHCFWSRGYGATSIRDLIEETGVTGASLYNAFGDKRAIYERALSRYVETSIADRIRRCEVLPPLKGIEEFFAEIVRRSLSDRDRKGCMLVNAALDIAPHDPLLQKSISEVLVCIEAFFLRCITSGQSDGTIDASLSAANHAHHLLSVLMGIRVLARVRPEATLLEGAVTGALAVLRPDSVEAKPRNRRRGGQRPSS